MLDEDRLEIQRQQEEILRLMKEEIEKEEIEKERIEKEEIEKERIKEEAKIAEQDHNTEQQAQGIKLIK